MRSEKKGERGEDVFLRMGRAGHSHNKLRNEKAMENITLYRKIFPKKERNMLFC